MRKNTDVVCIGTVVHDLMVMGIPKEALDGTHESYIADQMIDSVGGDAANQSCVLSRLGMNVSVVGKIGTDAVGEMIRSIFVSKGVDISHMVASDDCHNLTSIIVTKTDGRHTFLIGMGENDSLKENDITPDLFEGVKAVSLGSLYALGELDLNGAAGRILKAAKDAGAITFADMNFDLKGLGARAHDDTYRYADYLVPSYEEAHMVTGETEAPKMAEKLLEMGASHVVIKLGDKGCYFKDAQEEFYVDPYEITPVNTTGCGDNFVAGFISSLVLGMSHKEALEFATGVGGLNSQGIGASLVVQSRQMVEEFMASHEKRMINR